MATADSRLLPFYGELGTPLLEYALPVLLWPPNRAALWPSGFYCLLPVSCCAGQSGLCHLCISLESPSGRSPIRCRGLGLWVSPCRTVRTVLPPPANYFPDFPWKIQILMYKLRESSLRFVEEENHCGL